MPDEIRGFEGTSPQPDWVGGDCDGHRIAHKGLDYKQPLLPVEAPCTGDGQPTQVS